MHVVTWDASCLPETSCLERLYQPPSSSYPQYLMALKTLKDRDRFLMSALGLYSLRRRRLMGIGIPMINLRRSDDRLRFIMGIPLLIRRRLLREWRPRMWGTLPYVDATSDPLPPGAVKAGYLASTDSDLYVIRAVNAGGWLVFGYFNPDTSRGYYIHSVPIAFMKLHSWRYLWFSNSHIKTRKNVDVSE